MVEPTFSISMPEEAGAKSSRRILSMTFTWKMAKRAFSISKSVFDMGTAAAKEMARANAGRAMETWTMPRQVVAGLTQQYVSNGEDVMKKGLLDVDNSLDEVAEEISRVKESHAEATSDPGTYIHEETGDTYTVTTAWEQIREDSEFIKVDREGGIKVHQHLAQWVIALGHILPYVEVVGLLAWFTWLWHVDILRPFTNLLVWILTAVLVLVFTFAVAFLSKRAGWYHNHAREERSSGNPHEAEKLYFYRNGLLGIAAGLGLVLFSTLAVRGVDALSGDDKTVSNILIITSLCLVVGFAMPGFAYAGQAFNGSVRSRRLASLSAWGNDMSEQQADAIDIAKSSLDACEEIIGTLISATLPRVCEETVTEVYSAVRCYHFAFIQIGSSNIQLPSKPGIFQEDSNGVKRLVSEIALEVDGASALSMQPVTDRLNRLATYEAQLVSLGRQLEQVKKLPFSGN